MPALTSVPHSQTWRRTYDRPSRICAQVEEPSSGTSGARADTDIDHSASAEIRKVAASASERGARSQRRHEQPAERRSGEAQRERPCELLEGVRLAELRGRQDLGQDRVAGGVEERLCAAVEGDDHHHVPQREHAGGGERAHQRQQQRARDVRGEHHPAAVLAVADEPAEEQQRDQWDAHRDAQQGERRRTAGDRVGLPRECDEEDAVAEQRHAAATEQAPEVEVRERPVAARGGGATGPRAGARGQAELPVR